MTTLTDPRAASELRPAPPLALKMGNQPHAALKTLFTRISFSRLRVAAISYADCIRISVSILTPNAFSIRSAMSPDSPAFPFSKLDSVGRETPSAAAAAVTDSPCASTISVLMKSPGCSGLLIGIPVTTP